MLDENRYSYSLNALSYDYLGEAKSEKLLTEAAVDFGVDPKAELWKLPSQFVGPYAEQDARLAFDLYKFFKLEINKEGLETIFDLETRLTPCLIDMTFRGVRIDLEKCERTKQELLKEEKQKLKQIKDLAGMDVEIWAAASLWQKRSINWASNTPGRRPDSPLLPRSFCLSTRMISQS